VEDVISNSKGELFTSDQIFDFFHGFNELDNFQLVEKSKGDFELLCVPTEGAHIDKEQIVREFKNFFDSDVFLKTYIVKTIKSEDGGKFRFIKSKSFKKI
jgi:phenylacetate-CoA ligase